LIVHFVLSILRKNRIPQKYRLLLAHKLPPVLVLFTVCRIVLLPSNSAAASMDKIHRSYPKSIIDYREHLSPLFPKRLRKNTQYIIVHTSECDLKTTLKIVSKGKQDDYIWVSRGGHTHYVIARDGITYRILDEKFRAHHAGRSMWNGTRNINRISVGIELVGYHDGIITAAQYKSIRQLIEILKTTYHLDDLAVLTHSQVAYSESNELVPFANRGRKHCAQNFDRKRAGLKPTWPYDPDVRAGRLQPDPELSSVFYGNETQAGPQHPTYVIQPNKTAWEIAGDKYDSPNTIYKLPGGLLISGNRIHKKIGWEHIPAGTEVFVD